MRALLFSLVALLTVLGGAVAWIYHQGSSAAKTAEKVATVEQKAVVADLNTQGVRQSEQRVHITVGTQQAAAALASQYRAEAQAAGDAHAPLDPDRAQRLHSGDRGMCALDPSLGGCAANSDAPGSALPVLTAPGSSGDSYGGGFGGFLSGAWRCPGDLQCGSSSGRPDP